MAGDSECWKRTKASLEVTPQNWRLEPNTWWFVSIVLLFSSRVFSGSSRSCSGMVTNEWSSCAFGLDRHWIWWTARCFLRSTWKAPPSFRSPPESSKQLWIQLRKILPFLRPPPVWSKIKKKNAGEVKNPAGGSSPDEKSVRNLNPEFHPRLWPMEKISWDYHVYFTFVLWLVVSTQLKNICQNGSSSPNRGENKKHLKPPPSTPFKTNGWEP